MTCQRLHVVRIVRRQALGCAGEAMCTDFTSEPTCHGYGVNDWQLDVTYWTTRPFWLADTLWRSTPFNSRRRTTERPDVGIGEIDVSRVTDARGLL